MFKPYTGEGWCLDADGNRIPCAYTQQDGMVKAVCDICGDSVCDEDGEGGNIFVSEGEADELALDYDWLVIGKHHICSRCRDRIERGEMDIEIKAKGV